MQGLPVKLTKVERGWYASEDGRFAVVADGYSPSQSQGAGWSGSGAGETLSYYEGFIAGEWAAVYSARGGLRENSNDGTNLDWFPTKREAVSFIQSYAAREAS